jgi:hypothetical protein
MKLVTFKTEHSQTAVNPDMVTSVSPHFSIEGSTVISFAGDENDYVTVAEDWPVVIRKLENYTP